MKQILGWFLMATLWYFLVLPLFDQYGIIGILLGTMFFAVYVAWTILNLLFTGQLSIFLFYVLWVMVIFFLISEEN